MISKEEYVLNRVKSLLHHKAKNNYENPELLV